MSKDVKKRSSWKQMTQREYEGIKAMQNAGVSNSAVVKATGRGSGTISYIFKSNDYNHYRELIAGRSRYYRLKKAENGVKVEKVEKTKKAETPEQAELPMDSKDPMIAVMERLADAVERSAKASEKLVAAWEARPEAPVKKRGLF